MTEDPLARKESNVLETVCNSDIQNIISQPNNDGLCFSFPISNLIKKNSDCRAEVFAYGRRNDGFQDWYA